MTILSDTFAYQSDPGVDSDNDGISELSFVSDLSYHIQPLERYIPTEPRDFGANLTESLSASIYRDIAKPFLDDPKKNDESTHRVPLVLQGTIKSSTSPLPKRFDYTLSNLVSRPTSDIDLPGSIYTAGARATSRVNMRMILRASIMWLFSILS